MIDLPSNNAGLCKNIKVETPEEKHHHRAAALMGKARTRYALVHEVAYIASCISVAFAVIAMVVGYQWLTFTQVYFPMDKFRLHLGVVIALIALLSAITAISAWIILLRGKFGTRVPSYDEAKELTAAS